MAETTLELIYSRMVPGLFNIHTPVNVYRDERYDLWEFLHAKNGTQKNIVDYVVSEKSKLPRRKIVGDVSYKDEDCLVVQTKDDEYTFKYMTQEELDDTEHFMSTGGFVGMIERMTKNLQTVRNEMVRYEMRKAGLVE